MDKEIQTWLYDIRQSIAEIDSYFENKPKRFDEYTSDIKTKRAIERNFEIIGEAANRILRKDKSFKLDNIEKIIGMRNRIIHGYDKVSDDLVWSILINHLPKLKDEVETLLNK
ncbi:MAG TPA: HepT-like ribonuclease domain-containing protein [Bacteroidales bacterium]|nr:HepT-like ribonuclease domain-containing protein [Bacteroidales bacterium]